MILMPVSSVFLVVLMLVVAQTSIYFCAILYGIIERRIPIFSATISVDVQAALS